MVNLYGIEYLIAEKQQQKQPKEIQNKNERKKVENVSEVK